MTDSEVSATAELLTAARAALERYLDVHVDDDGALSFQHGDVPCAVQSIQLVEGLAVLSLTCVVAWDLPDSPELTSSVAYRSGEGLFGTLGLVHTDRGIDVILRYTFPAAGLEEEPLGTLLMLVVSTAGQVRTEVLADLPER
ncbi:MAG TPA: hypothetical protein VF444_13640 [Pseudonocardiaceae bacterium]